jgi:hypothetical protein
MDVTCWQKDQTRTYNSDRWLLPCVYHTLEEFNGQLINNGTE